MAVACNMLIARLGMKTECQCGVDHGMGEPNLLVISEWPCCHHDGHDQKTQVPGATCRLLIGGVDGKCLWDLLWPWPRDSLWGCFRYVANVS